MDFSPLLFLKNRAQPKILENRKFFERLRMFLGRKSGHLPGFCPLLKTDLATKNPVFMRV
jgi:hypothetical protein